MLDLLIALITLVIATLGLATIAVKLLLWRCTCEDSIRCRKGYVKRQR